MRGGSLFLRTGCRGFFIAAARDGTLSYRATGTVTVRPSPGAKPNALPLPVQTTDFELVQALNAPWLTAADIPEPPKPPVQSVNGEIGAVVLSASSVGALATNDVYVMRSDQYPSDTRPGWLLSISGYDPGARGLVMWNGFQWWVPRETGMSLTQLNPDGYGLQGSGIGEEFYPWPTGPSARIATMNDIVLATNNLPGKSNVLIFGDNRQTLEPGSTDAAFSLTVTDRRGAYAEELHLSPGGLMFWDSTVGATWYTAAGLHSGVYGDKTYATPTGPSSPLATLRDIANATNNLPQGGSGGGTETNYTTYTLVANFQYAAGMGMTFSQQFSGWLIATENITPSAVTNFSQAYLPTVVRPGSQVRVVAHHASATALFRGRIVIPYNVSTVYAQGIEWKTLDVEQPLSGTATWTKALSDSGWMPLAGPDQGVYGDNIHDIAPYIRARWDLSGIDKSGIVSNGTIAVRFIVRIPDVQSNDDKFGW